MEGGGGEYVADECAGGGEFAKVEGKEKLSNDDDVVLLNEGADAIA